jgi:hypothetical protein
MNVPQGMLAPESREFPEARMPCDVAGLELNAPA